jgi:hypothetical protein
MKTEADTPVGQGRVLELPVILRRLDPGDLGDPGGPWGTFKECGKTLAVQVSAKDRVDSGFWPSLRSARQIVPLS